MVLRVLFLGDGRIRVVVVADRQVAPLGDGDRREDDHERDRGDAVANGRGRRRPDREGDDGRGDEHRDEVHHLDERVDRRTGRVLEGVTDGVADDRRGMRLGALATVVPVLDDLLRVVPRTTGVREEDRHERAGADGAGEEACKRADAQAETDRDRRQRSQQTGRGEFTQGVAGADVDDLAVLRLCRALHDPRDLAELTAHLEDDRAGSAGHGVDRQAGEHEDDRRTEDEADEGLRAGDQTEGIVEEALSLGLGDLGGVELLDRALPSVGVGAEERRRSQNRRGDGDALGDRLGRVADRVELGEDLGALPVDVARHLGDALCVVRDRTEGVHGDDDADRREQATAGERDEEEGQGDRSAAEEEGGVDRGPDDGCGVDRRFQADADAREHDRRGTRQRGAGHVDGRALVGAGEVAGEPQDDAGEDDADEDGRDRDIAWVAVEGRDLLVGRVELGVRGGQVDPRGDRGEDRRDGCGDVEATVDRRQRVLTRACLGDVDTDEGGDRADRRDDQREDQTEAAEGSRAEDERGNQRHGIRLEEVGRHAGAVADVVTDVVGDRRRVARVVLRDAGLDLADEIGAHVGGLGEDATPDAHEHREQGGAESEAFEDLGGVPLVEQDDDGGTEQTQADRGHPDDAAGAEGDAHAFGATVRLAGRGGDAHVGLDRQAHAQVPDGCREEGADDEEDRTPDLDVCVARQDEQQGADDDDEDAEGLELTRQVGLGALLDSGANGPHVLRAGIRSQNLSPEHEAHDQGDDRDGGHRDDQGEIRAREFDRGARCRQGEPECCHSILLDKVRRHAPHLGAPVPWGTLPVTQFTARSRGPRVTTFTRPSPPAPLRRLRPAVPRSRERHQRWRGWRRPCRVR